MKTEALADQVQTRVLTDRQMALGQLRLDIESELYLLCRGEHSFDPSLLLVPGNQSPVNYYLDRLEGRIWTATSGTLGSVRRFYEESDRDSDFKYAEALCGKGAIIAQGVKYRRHVAWLEEDFRHHLLWHVGSGSSNSKYPHWSAVAAQVSHFEYNYDAYVEAAVRLNKSIASWEPPFDKMYTLSLSEFIAVLEFRESELRRIIESWDIQKGFRAKSDWHWPSEWGEVHWNGPVLRGNGGVPEAEREYLGTRSWLQFYRLRVEPPVQSKFSVTFDDDVPAEDVASFLSFIHRHAVEKGGSGLLLRSSPKESG